MEQNEKILHLNPKERVEGEVPLENAPPKKNYGFAGGFEIDEILTTSQATTFDNIMMKEVVRHFKETNKNPPIILRDFFSSLILGSEPQDLCLRAMRKKTKFPLYLTELSPRSVLALMKVAIMGFPDFRHLVPMFVLRSLKKRASLPPKMKYHQNDAAAVISLISLANWQCTLSVAEEQRIQAFDQNLSQLLFEALLRRYFRTSGVEGSLEYPFSNAIDLYMAHAVKMYRSDYVLRVEATYNYLKLIDSTLKRISSQSAPPIIEGTVEFCLCRGIHAGFTSHLGFESQVSTTISLVERFKAARIPIIETTGETLQIEGIKIPEKGK